MHILNYFTINFTPEEFRFSPITAFTVNADCLMSRRLLFKANSARTGLGSGIIPDCPLKARIHKINEFSNGIH